MKDFKIHSVSSDLVVKKLNKASSTVLEEGDMVALTAAGLATKATSTDTSVAYVCAPAVDGDTEVLVTSSPGLVFSGAADANFTAAMRGIECDLVGTTTQLLDVGASATKVFKIEAGDNAGTVGSSDEILFTISRPL